MTTTTPLPRPTRLSRLTAIAAFLWSLLALPIGLWQLLDPEHGPYAHDLYDPTIPLPAAVPDWTAPAALIAAGIGGLLIARARPSLWPLTALYAAVFGLLLTTITPISFAGYLAAFLIPIAAVVVPVLLARGTIARMVTAAAIAAVVVGLGVTGVVDYAAVGAFAADLGGTIAAMSGYLFAQVWTVAGAAIWTALTLQLLLRRRDGEPVPAWLAPENAAKWGRVAAWTAFACALPYGLVRMSWLTPWPYMGGPLGDELDLTTRVWGLLLGFAALGGGVLCLGLSQRWGERWPFWMFAVKGRPVPPMIAIVPGAIMAAVFTFMAVPMAATGIRQGAYDIVWSFPFWLWGPALGAATLAYAIRRGKVGTGVVR
ncbi:hypothetical protein O1R50_07045 [Glycomyces luteolus]|uniref:Uncharacterized protein n=1 Tax=Glycomyces luteolus TaxID=2670330 RepID=A0A9X3P9V2_9ACTN|nr:hypothetical protein [Glycomyces luteolus]MDA1359370.1 hypothetical protein [Glycomyces luteolus]